MDDLIKRQDAIDAIRASTSKYTGFMEMEMYTDDDAVEAINGVPSAQQWIPVSERSPNIGEDILFSVADLYTAEGCLRDDGDYCQFRWNSIIPKDRVTAWMPLPEPFKEVKE